MLSDGREYPPVEPWVCLYCGSTVSGGRTHKCPK